MPKKKCFTICTMVKNLLNICQFHRPVLILLSGFMENSFNLKAIGYAPSIFLYSEYNLSLMNSCSIAVFCLFWFADNRLYSRWQVYLCTRECCFIWSHLNNLWFQFFLNCTWSINIFFSTIFILGSTLLVAIFDNI